MKNQKNVSSKSNIKFNPEANLTECLNVRSEADAKEWLKQYK